MIKPTCQQQENALLWNSTDIKLGRFQMPKMQGIAGIITEEKGTDGQWTEYTA